MITSKTAVAILAHKNIDYIIYLAKAFPEAVFIVHFDLKVHLDNNKEAYALENVHFIEERTSVYWAGFSQVEAVIKLLSFAVKLKSIQYIHLISAECFPLIPFSEMEQEWDKNPNLNYIESHHRADNEWRVRTWMPHADTKHMRTFPGKVLKRTLRFISYFVNTSGIKGDAYYGSLWCSINREFAQKVVAEYENGNFFKKYVRITCADEHAFATYIRAEGSCKIADDNKRYIEFPPGASNPKYLNLDHVLKMNKKNWFSRKFHESEMISKLKEFKHD